MRTIKVQSLGPAKMSALDVHGFDHNAGKLDQGAMELKNGTKNNKQRAIGCI